MKTLEFKINEDNIFLYTVDSQRNINYFFNCRIMILYD